jgi:hemolysin III
MGPIRRRKTPNHLDSPPIPANPRAQSRGELVADAVVHALGLASGVIGAIALVSLIAGNGNGLELAAILIYAAGLIAMLGCSAAYHVARAHPRRDLLQRFDHAAIFAMIAGTYTPFTILGLEGGWRIGMTVAVWALAGVGIAVKLFAPARRSTRISTALYLALGWMGVVAIEPLLHGVSPAVLILIAIGGGLYSVGVVFHALQRMPYQNAIWHAFVLAAAMVHFAAVSGMVAAAG